MSPTPSTYCVGWPADPPCPVYGIMHGCKRDDGHTGRHVCECGNDQAYTPASGIRGRAEG